MEAQQDFRYLLELFNDHGVEYIIVGAYALAYHGAPRYTGDIDMAELLCATSGRRSSFLTSGQLGGRRIKLISKLSVRNERMNFY